MESYIARQPIYNTNREVVAYELLYRDGENKTQAVFTDGDKATSRLVSDAITLFGLSNLTNKKPAFINFTENLIMDDFAYLSNPNEVTIEVLESVNITIDVIEKLKEIKKRGYRLALDDFTGKQYYDDLLRLVNYIKVDFLLTDEAKQAEVSMIPKRYPNVILLAEKVETEEQFNRAVSQGYKLFQGYFFSRPKTLHKKVPEIAATSYAMIIAELNRKGDLDFDKCAKIIHRDVVMTYRILQKVNTLKYYRGNEIKIVKMALVMMGEYEVRRYIMLMLARDNNITESDELVRKAYLRGVFGKEIMLHSPLSHDSEDGFFLGMFSMLDVILGIPIEDLVKSISIPDEIRKALAREEESFYSNLLDFIVNYELGEEFDVKEKLGINLDWEEISEVYMESIIKTDIDFNLL